MDRVDSSTKLRLGNRTLLPGDMGFPNCTFIGTSFTPLSRTAFVLALDPRNAAHGRTSDPLSQCLRPGPGAPVSTGCNADGVLWAKALGANRREPSMLAQVPPPRPATRSPPLYTPSAAPAVSSDPHIRFTLPPPRRLCRLIHTFS
jgi:hypothetical protein